MYQISRTHLIGYLVQDGITSSVHAKHTFSRTSIMLRFAFCFRSCIILVRTPPLGGERGETPRGCCDGNPTLASVNSSQLQPQLAMSKSRRQPPTWGWLCLRTHPCDLPPLLLATHGTRTFPHFSSYFPLIAPTAAAALTSNDCWRPSRSFSAVSYTHLTLPTKA